MKLKKGFTVHDTGTESILIPMGGAGWSGVVKGNRTLGAILDLLKEDASEAAIIDAMKRRSDAPEDVVVRDVQRAVSELRKIGAIDGQDTVGRAVTQWKILQCSKGHQHVAHASEPTEHCGASA